MNRPSLKVKTRMASMSRSHNHGRRINKQQREQAEKIEREKAKAAKPKEPKKKKDEPKLPKNRKRSYSVSAATTSFPKEKNANVIPIHDNSAQNQVPAQLVVHQFLHRGRKGFRYIPE